MRRYIQIDMEEMRKNKLSINEWILLENILFQSNNEFNSCYTSKAKLAKYLDVSDRQIYKIIDKLIDEKWLKKLSNGYLKVTKKWLDIQSERPMQKMQNEYAKNAESTIKKEYKIEGLNENAFKMWCNYKGKSYKQQGKTLSANLLKKHTEDIQMKMVEKSIMNNWQGLFEIDSVQAKKKEVLI